MGRGIHRLHITFRRGLVKVRAQSRSPRGTPFTVGSSMAVLEGLSKSGRQQQILAVVDAAVAAGRKSGQAAPDKPTGRF